MALFQYFPNNYVWNLSINIAIESGGKIGEIEEMCRPLLEAAAKGEDAGIAGEGEIRNAIDVNEPVVTEALVIGIGVR